MYEISFRNKFEMNIDIPVSPRAEMQSVDVEMFVYFDLNGEKSSTSNVFETSSDCQQSCFGEILNSEIEKLILSQQNQNTKRNTR